MKLLNLRNCWKMLFKTKHCIKKWETYCLCKSFTFSNLAGESLFAQRENLKWFCFTGRTLYRLKYGQFLSFFYLTFTLFFERRINGIIWSGLKTYKVKFVVIFDRRFKSLRSSSEENFEVVSSQFMFIKWG